MANLSIPDKSPGDLHTSLEFDEQINWANSPQKSLSTINHSAVIVNSTGVYTAESVGGPISIVFSGTPINGNWQKQKLTGWDGSSHTFTAPPNSVLTVTGQSLTFTNGGIPDAGDYDLIILYWDDEYNITLKKRTVIGSDVTAPTMTSRTIENAAPTNLVMVFDEIVIGTNLGFTIAGTTSTTFASISGSGTNTITGVLGVAAVFGETITLSYDSGTGDIVDNYSNALATISSSAVTNNVGDVTAPTVSTMTVESASPNDLVVTFSDSCTFTNVGYTFEVNSVARTLTSVSGSPGTVATFLISGAAIVNTETLTLAYSSATGDTIKVSNSVELVTFTATEVTNNISWSPSNLGAKLKLWLEKGVGITEAGTGVSLWADQSGNGYDFEQATDANRPSYNSGTGEITFISANSDELKLPTAKVSNFNTDSDGWLLIVGEKQSTNFTAFIAANDSVDTDYVIPIVYENAGADARDDHVAIIVTKPADGNSVYGDTTAISTDTAFYVLIEAGSSSYEIYTNGVQQNIALWSGLDDGRWLGHIGSGLNQISIGSLPRNSPAYYDIVVKEIIYGSTALTGPERVELVNYASNV